MIGHHVQRHGDHAAPPHRVRGDRAEVEQPEQRTADRQRERRQPGHHDQRAAEQAGCSDQQRAGRGLLRPAPVERDGEDRQRRDEDQISPAVPDQHRRARPAHGDGPLGAVDLIGQQVSGRRPPDPTRRLGQPVTGDGADHVPGAERRVRHAGRDVDDHAVRAPGRPAEAEQPLVSRRVEAYGNGQQSDHQQRCGDQDGPPPVPGAHTSSSRWLPIGRSPAEQRRTQHAGSIPSRARSTVIGRPKVRCSVSAWRTGASSRSPLSASPPPSRTRSTPVMATAADGLGQRIGGLGPHRHRVRVPGPGPYGDLLRRTRSAGPRGVLPFDRGPPQGSPGTRWPHPQGGPAGSTTRCPSSPAQPSALTPRRRAAVPRRCRCRQAGTARRRTPRAHPAGSRPAARRARRGRRRWARRGPGHRVADRQVPPAEVHRETPTPRLLVHQAGDDHAAADQPRRTSFAPGQQVGHRRVTTGPDRPLMSAGVGVVTAASVS